MKTNLIIVLLSMFGYATSIAQVDHSSELFEILRLKDSMLFEVSYNQLNTAPLEELINEDFEFYHDQGGFMDTKQGLIESIKGFANLPYTPKRVLMENSLEVFPLYKNGELYGAIQRGDHAFYGIEEGKPEYLTSSAKFTHVWILVEGEWKLKRILSYNHLSTLQE